MIAKLRRRAPALLIFGSVLSWRKHLAALALLVLGALFVAGCGGSSDDGNTEESKGPAPEDIFVVENPQIDLKITAIKGKVGQTWTLQCDPEPIGGDYPLTKTVCPELNEKLLTEPTKTGGGRVPVAPFTVIIQGKAYEKPVKLRFGNRAGWVDEAARFTKLNKIFAFEQALATVQPAKAPGNKGKKPSSSKPGGQRAGKAPKQGK